MKKHILLLVTVITTLVSCAKYDYDAILEQLRDHEERIQKLETLCTQLNSNVEAIQTILAALEQNDYITEITKITEDGIEVGYSITFAKGGTVNIYHGSNGSNAQAPKISIRKAQDGEYYWTSDDEWLTDENGDKIPASVPDDPDGKYITPQFRVADGKWYVSFDNGNTWQETTDVNDSGAIFKDVSHDEDYVYFTLMDGTTITLLKAKTENVTISLKEYRANSVTFQGEIQKKTVDLMVTVYYDTKPHLTIYNHAGKVSINQFDSDSFTLTIGSLENDVTYYYFIEVVSDGRITYSPIDTFFIDTAAEIPGWTRQMISYGEDAWANSTVRKNGMASISDGSSKDRLAYTVPFDIPQSGRVMVTCGNEYEWAIRSGQSENDMDENQYWLSNGDQLQIAHSAAGGKMALIIRKNSNVPKTPFQCSADPATQQVITKDDALASRIKVYFKDTYTSEFDTSEWLLVDTPSTEESAWLRATVTENGPGKDGSKTKRLTYDYVYDASGLNQNDVIMVTCNEGYQWAVRTGKQPGNFKQNQFWYNSGTPIRFYQGPNAISVGTASEFMVVFRKVSSHNVSFDDSDALDITKDDIQQICPKIYTSYSSNPVKKYKARGKVTYSDGPAASGICISDGFNVTQTDSEGNYTLTTSDDTYYIYYSLPENCKVTTNDYGQPAFFLRYDKNKASHDFTLELMPGGKEDSFSLFCLADPQCANSSDRNRLVNETLPDVKLHAAAKDEPCYGVTLGDVAYSNNSRDAVMEMPYLRDHFSVINTSMPVFQVMGNHDNIFFSSSSPLTYDETSSTYNLKAQRAFEEIFGPIDYSWNRGDVHIVCMRNIQYTSQTSQSQYVIGFTDSQLEWLKQDLSYVPKDKMLIMCVHIPMSEGDLDGSSDNVKRVSDLISEYKEVHIMAGHRHYVRNLPDMYEGIYEHTHAAVCGAWWASNVNPDGTPNGYGVYDIEGSTIKNWYHKGVNSGMNSLDYQLRLHMGNMQTGGSRETFQLQHADNVLLANVFNADSEWVIKVYENGVYSGDMELMPVKSYIPAKGTPTYIPVDSSQDWWSIGYHVGVKNKSRTNNNLLCDCHHMYIYTLKDKNSSIRVEATDRFGRTYAATEMTDADDYTILE